MLPGDAPKKEVQKRRSAAAHVPPRTDGSPLEYVTNTHTHTLQSPIAHTHVPRTLTEAELHALLGKKAAYPLYIALRGDHGAPLALADDNWLSRCPNLVKELDLSHVRQRTAVLCACFSIALCRTSWRR